MFYTRFGRSSSVSAGFNRLDVTETLDSPTTSTRQDVTVPQVPVTDHSKASIRMNNSLKNPYICNKLKMMKKEYLILPNEAASHIDIKSIPKGIYIVKIYDDTGLSFSQRIIKH